MNDRATFHAVLRRDFPAFVAKCFVTISPGGEYMRNWHIEAIAHTLMRVHNQEISRLLINQPPRSLKSICVSVAYVAWLLGHDPTRRVIVVSYSQELAAELHRQFRMVVDSEWYKIVFPAMRLSRDNGFECITSQGGGRYATSVGGTLTGRGADLIVIDDPLKAEEATSEAARKRVIEFFSGTLLTRLNDKLRGSIIVVMQRLHEDDLAGHLLEQGSWFHLNLQAIATEDSLVPLPHGKTRRRLTGDVLHPERETLATLQRIKSEIGSLMFAAQYQQSPVPLEGNLIMRGWFQLLDEMPSPSPGRVIQSWDVAMATNGYNDYSVCTTWLVLKKNYYLLDVFRERLQYPDLRRQVGKLAAMYSAETVIIEDAGPGTILLQDLRRDLPASMPRPIGMKPIGSKADRMVAQSAKIEAHRVSLPRRAIWLDCFLHELLAFPHSRHDDQVDSVSQFLNYISRSTSPFEGMAIGLGAKVFYN